MGSERPSRAERGKQSWARVATDPPGTAAVSPTAPTEYQAANGRDLEERLARAVGAMDDLRLNERVAGSMDAQEQMSQGTEATLLAGSIAPAKSKPEAFLEVAELGRGGLGRVFVSVDMALQREVAVKEILPEMLSADATQADALRARFLREARVTGQLEHPNIVPVYEVGQRDDGRLYYSMRLIRGQTLKEAIDSSTTPGARLALLNHFLGLCHALAYAHSRGVIHRDIKPQNIMLGKFGESVVLDWGVAKVRGARDSKGPGPASAIREPAQGRPERTQLGQVIGTPAYMAPEALLGRPDQVDERSDVWSLGVVLHQLLYGRLPFDEKLSELVERARAASWQLAVAEDRDIPPELRAVITRALQSAPERRYQTAGEMAHDVEAYLTGAKVGAYAYSSWQLVWRFYVRHKAAVVVGVVAIVAIAALAIIGHRRVVASRDRALVAEQQQRASAAEARHSLARLLAEGASFALSRGDTANAQLLAARALTIERRQDALGALISLAPQAQPQLERSDTFHRSCSRVASAGSGDTVACASDSSVIAVVQGRLRVLGQHQAKVTALALSADGQWLYTADPTGVLKRWSVTTETVERERRFADSIAVLRLSHDQAQLAIGYDTGSVEVLGAPNLEPTELRSLGEPVSALAFSSEGALAAGGRSGKLSVWSAAGMQQAASFVGHAGTLTALEFAPNGRRLASGSADKTVRLWNVRSPDKPPTVMDDSATATSFAWSKSGKHLIYGTKSHMVHWVHTQLNRKISQLPGHQQSILSVAFSEDQKRLVSVDSRLTRRSWRIPDARRQNRLVEPTNVLALTWVKGTDGRSFPVSTGPRRLGACLWNVESGDCDTRLPVDAGEARALAASPDGRKLAVGGSDGVLFVWDLRTRLPEARLFGHHADLRCVAFSKDGRRLVSGDLDGRLMLWDIAAFRPIAQHALSGGINAVRVSPDGGLIAVGTRRGVVQIWDRGLERRRGTLEGHSDWVMDLAFLPGGGLATAGADGTVRLWNLASYEQLAKLDGGRGRTLTLDASSDGRWLAAAGEDKLVRLWSRATKELVATLRDHGGAVRSLRFSPDARTLATGSDDRSVRLWDLALLDAEPTQLLADAERRYGMKADEVELVR